MRWLLTLLVLLPSLALAQFPISRGGTVRSGPRILGEPAFAFELDALTQDEVSRPGWPVTTTRASTRMCFTGTAWQTVAANVPCIGRYGLVSFGPGTNYAANSADFSKATWSKGGAATVAEVAGGYRVTMPNVGSNIASPAQSVAAGETWTVSCYVRSTGTTSGIVIRPFTAATPGVSACAVPSTSDWARVSCTNTASGAGSAAAIVYANAAGTSVDLQQCQLEKSPTPGPRHDCGASACSWEGDVHTVPPAGWPVEAGEVRLQYTPLVSNPGVIRWLIDASIFNANGWELYVRDTNAIGFFSHRAGANSLYSSPALSWVGCDPTSTTCVPYDIRVAWGGGALRIWRDGVLVYENLSANMPEGPLTTPAVSIGARRTAPSSTPANGHIRLLRVSQ